MVFDGYTSLLLMSKTLFNCHVWYTSIAITRALFNASGNFQTMQVFKKKHAQHFDKTDKLTLEEWNQTCETIWPSLRRMSQAVVEVSKVRGI